MRVPTIIAIATMGCATMVVAQTEILTPPTSIEKVFVLTDEFVALSSDEVAHVGYPVWQKVGMNGTSGAVPANWCQPLLLAKPWLIAAFGDTIDTAKQNCWLSVSLVTAELEGIEVPESSQTKWTPWWDTFWRNRPDGYEYWVPAFSVSQSVFASTMGTIVPTATAFDPTPLVIRIDAIEAKVAAAQRTADAAQAAAATNASDISQLKKDVAGLNRPLTPVEQEATLWGVGLQAWLQALVVAFLLLFLLMLTGFLVRRRWRAEDTARVAEIDKRLTAATASVTSMGTRLTSLGSTTLDQGKQLSSLQGEVERLKETTSYLIERDMVGRIKVEGFTYEKLNSLQPGESLPDFVMAELNGGNPVGAPHVRMTREDDSVGKPLLRIVGACKPGEDTIPAKKNRQGEWHFTVPQVLAKLNLALEKGEVWGLGKREAAVEPYIVPGTQRPKVKPGTVKLSGCDEFIRYAAKLDAESAGESLTAQVSELKKIKEDETEEKPLQTEPDSKAIGALADVILNPAKAGEKIPTRLAQLTQKMAEAKNNRK